MRGAPAGAVVRLGYDWHGRSDPPPGEGDYLLSRAGSLYEILDAIPVRGYQARFRLRCLKLDASRDMPGPQARVVDIVWEPRSRRRLR